MIDTYKQVLVGQYTAPEAEGERLLDDEQLRAMAAKGVDAVFSNDPAALMAALG